MKPLYILSFTVFLFCFIVLGCKKNKQSLTNDFTWTVPLVDSPIHFINNGGGILQWDFGDTTTSSESRPYHIYRQSGTFTVKLTINNNNSDTIEKTITVYDNPVYTHLIGGYRSWHHTHTVNEQGYPPSTFSYSDTSFAVNYINPLVICIGFDTLNYLRTSDSTLYFYHSDNYSLNYGYLSFKYISDTVTFQQFIHTSSAGSTTESWTSF